MRHHTVPGSDDIPLCADTASIISTDGVTLRQLACVQNAARASTAKQLRAKLAAAAAAAEAAAAAAAAADDDEATADSDDDSEASSRSWRPEKAAKTTAGKTVTAGPWKRSLQAARRAKAAKAGVAAAMKKEACEQELRALDVEAAAENADAYWQRWRDKGNETAVILAGTECTVPPASPKDVIFR
jgi:hypothetical protein